MANIQNGGFRCVGTLSGSPFPKPMVREVASGYATAIGIGDPLTTVSDGTLAVGATADNGKLVGVCTGVSWVQSGRRTMQAPVPASTTFSPSTVGSPNATLIEFVPCTPDVIFAVQADEGTTFATIATQISAIQENCDMTVGTPDATTGYSTFSLDISTHATATFNWRIINIVGYSMSGIQLATNDPTASRFEFWVVCNESVYPTGTPTGV